MNFTNFGKNLDVKNKNKLYEIFAKVNKLPLNEQEGDVDVEQAWDDFNDKVTDSIKDENVKTFKNDIVPNEIEINTIDLGTLNLVLNDEYGLNGLEFTNGVDGQLNYSAQYTTTIENVEVIIVVPLTIMIEKSYRGDGTLFYIDNISLFFREADIEINR